MLELIRGDDNIITMLVKRPRLNTTTGEPLVDGYGRPVTDPVNLTGSALIFTARNRRKEVVISLSSLADGTATATIVFQEPLTNGHATGYVEPDVTDALATPSYLKYDVQLIENVADTTSQTITTIARGDAVVVEDETRG